MKILKICYFFHASFLCEVAAKTAGKAAAAGGEDTLYQTAYAGLVNVGASEGSSRVGRIVNSRITSYGVGNFTQKGGEGTNMFSHAKHMVTRRAHDPPPRARETRVACSRPRSSSCATCRPV